MEDGGSSTIFHPPSSIFDLQMLLVSLSPCLLVPSPPPHRVTPSPCHLVTLSRSLPGARRRNHRLAERDLRLIVQPARAEVLPQAAQNRKLALEIGLEVGAEEVDRVEAETGVDRVLVRVGVAHDVGTHRAD